MQMIILMDRPLANDHPDGLASCKWSSRWTGLLKMIILINRPLANDHPDGPASCKWSYWSTGLLQMIIMIELSLANDHLDGSASFKWLSERNNLYKMIIMINRPFANDHLDGQAFCKWSFWSISLLQMIIRIRVRRDPGARPVPNFFSSTRPVPTQKLKMTGYRVIRFHFESNKTQPRMRNPAYEVTNPINPSTENHFFVNYWGKWARTDAVISS